MTLTRNDLRIGRAVAFLAPVLVTVLRTLTAILRLV